MSDLSVVVSNVDMDKFDVSPVEDDPWSQMVDGMWRFDVAVVDTSLTYKDALAAMRDGTVFRMVSDGDLQELAAALKSWAPR